MSRSEFSKKTKAQAYERSGGNCEMCGVKLQIGKFHYDHEIPDALGGSNDLENCNVACTACHGVKTTMEDVPRIAKMKRLHANHIGAGKSKPKLRGAGFRPAPPQKRASRPLEKWRGY